MCLLALLADSQETLMEPKKWTLQLGGRLLEIEAGQLAGQANGAVTARYGDTVVLATAVMSREKAQVKGYFPLMVDYEERFYAAGKIKGSRFIKREGRPSDGAILNGRIVDRTIRPLFDNRLRNEVQVIVTVLSFDGENDPNILAMVAASAALHISDVPWNGPIGAVRVGLVDEKLVINPTSGNGDSEKKESQLDLILAGTKDKINMMEAGANEIPEEKVLEAIELGQQYIAKIADFIEEIRKEIGKEKKVGIVLRGTEEQENEIRKFLTDNKIEETLYSEADKEEKYQEIKELQEKLKALIKQKYPDDGEKMLEIADLVYEDLSDEILHKKILEEDSRPDRRKLDQVRDLSCQVGVLPRTHGSGLFRRGETQVLTVATLASPGSEQLIDTMEETDEKKRYMHHYNFPPYSVGEIKPMRGPGRREIGHGALAERALEPMIPSREDFPYTIRLVSEVLSSNGSSSMASTCGSTLALMDSGVPIKNPVSGIAMGIIIKDEKNYKILSDIQGLEDHFGDMDFKVTGTENGITALQMDIKVDGVTPNMLKDALSQSKKNRKEILETMLAALPKYRENLSPYAPRVIKIRINPDKIRDVIGPGGKVINEIIDETGVQIDIEDDGMVFITSTDEISAKKAKEWVENITHEVKPGEIFKGRITRLMNFGAFAEILPGQEGLIHISELADYRVNKVEDIVKVGDVVPVKVKEIDNQGRINLSLKDAAKMVK